MEMLDLVDSEFASRLRMPHFFPTHSPPSLCHLFKYLNWGILFDHYYATTHLSEPNCVMAASSDFGVSEMITSLSHQQSESPISFSIRDLTISTASGWRQRICPEQYYALWRFRMIHVSLRHFRRSLSCSG
jgi:hypothetical protein